MKQIDIHIFQQFKTIRSFGNSTLMVKLSNPLGNILEFNDRGRPRAQIGINKNSNTFESINALYEDRELVLNAFKSEIFPLKSARGQKIKILAFK